MTGESGVGIRGAAGVRGAPQGAGRGALERGDPGTLNAPDKERAARVCEPLLPSGCKGSPQPSKASSSASSRLQLASSRLWSSAASIAPRSRARRGSVTARPAWLPGAGFESERPRERSLGSSRPAPTCQQPPGASFERRELPGLDLSGEEPQNAPSCGSTRSVAANGCTRGRGRAAPLCQALAPAPGPPVQPNIRLLWLTPGPEEGGGNGQCGPSMAE